MLFRCVLVCLAFGLSLIAKNVSSAKWPILCAQIPTLNMSMEQLSGSWNLLEAYYFYMDGPRAVSISNGTSQICIKSDVTPESSVEMSMSYNFTFINRNRTTSYLARFNNLGNDLGRWNVANVTQQIGAQYLLLAADPDRFFVSAECQITSTRPPKKYAKIATRANTVVPTEVRNITYFNYLIGVNFFTRHQNYIEMQEVVEVRRNIAAILGLDRVEPTQYSTAC